MNNYFIIGAITIYQMYPKFLEKGDTTLKIKKYNH